MSTSLSIPGILARVQWVFTSTGTAGDTSTSSSFSYSKALTNGTGANQANRMFAVNTTLGTSATVNYDLAGSLTDVFGATITFARIKAVYFELTTDTAATSVLFGGHATLAWGTFFSTADTLDNDQPSVKVRNGGVFLLSAPDATGYPVTAGSEDILSIVNQDASNLATYKLVLIGSAT